MGKGDIKTKRGKRSNGSYGKHRSKKVASTVTVAKKTSTAIKKKPTKKVATAKKEI